MNNWYWPTGESYVARKISRRKSRPRASFLRRAGSFLLLLLLGAGIGFGCMLGARIENFRATKFHGIKQDWSAKISPRHFLATGVDAKWLESNYDYYSLSEIIDPLIIGGGPPLIIERDSDIRVTGWDRNGLFRWYSEHDLPDWAGGGTIGRTPLIGPPAMRAGVGWSASTGGRTRLG